MTTRPIWLVPILVNCRHLRDRKYCGFDVGDNERYDRPERRCLPQEGSRGRCEVQVKYGY